MFLKTGVITNFAIFTRISWIVLESLVNKIAGLTGSNFISTSSQKRLNAIDSCENYNISTNSFFCGTPPVAAFVSLIK